MCYDKNTGSGTPYFWKCNVLHKRIQIFNKNKCESDNSATHWNNRSLAQRSRVTWLRSPAPETKTLSGCNGLASGEIESSRDCRTNKLLVTTSWDSVKLVESACNRSSCSWCIVFCNAFVPQLRKWLECCWSWMCPMATRSASGSYQFYPECIS